MSVQLFALPYAGGSASIYRDWILNSNSSLNINSIEYKGHAGRFSEDFYKSIEDAAEDISEIIIAQRKNDYLIYGHSMGALVALETEYVLERKGAVLPKAIIVAASRPPHLRGKGKQLGIMSQDELMQYMISRGQYDSEILENKELMDLLSDIMYADVQMFSKYSHEYESDKISVPILALAGEADEETPLDDMKEWQKYTTSSFEFLMFKGDHFFAFNDNDEFIEFLVNYVQTR